MTTSNLNVAHTNAGVSSPEDGRGPRVALRAIESENTERLLPRGISSDGLSRQLQIRAGCASRRTRLSLVRGESRSRRYSGLSSTLPTKV